MAVLGNDKAVLCIVQRISRRRDNLQQVVPFLGLQVPAQLFSTHDHAGSHGTAVSAVRRCDGVIGAVGIFHRRSADNISVRIDFVCLKQLEHGTAKACAVDQAVALIEIQAVVGSVAGRVADIVFIAVIFLVEAQHVNLVVVMDLPGFVGLALRLGQIGNRGLHPVRDIEGDRIALHIKIRSGHRISFRIRCLDGLVAVDGDRDILITDGQVGHLVRKNQYAVIGKG